MLDTTHRTASEQRTTRDAGPQSSEHKSRHAFRAALIMVALTVVAAVAFAIVSRSALGPATDIDITSGFEYNTDATVGKPAGTLVTGQYFGNSDEMFPERDRTSGFEYNTDATVGRPAGTPVTGQYFGNSDEMFPERDRTSGFEYNTDATVGKPAGTPVTGQYFGNSPELNPDH